MSPTAPSLLAPAAAWLLGAPEPSGPGLPALLALCAGSFLLGGVPFGLILGLAKGVDIRKVGSGNVGATNLSRALGRPWGIAAFLLDLAKGLVPVLVAGALESPPGGRSVLGTGGWDLALVGILAILGHVFSPYLRFRGGKGVATTFGVMAALSWLAALVAGVVWLACFAAFRVVSIASLAAAAALPVAVAVLDRGRTDGAWPAVQAFSIAVALLIVVRHRSNIQRLLRGEELAPGRGARGPDAGGGAT